MILARYALPLVAAAVLLIPASSSRATLVTTGTTTNFYDNFEAPDALGSLPSANIGTWLHVGPATTLAVSNAVPPGAAEGSQYLKMWRAGSQAHEAADFSTISSGNLKLAWSMFIPTNAPNDMFSVFLTDSSGPAAYSGAKTWLTINPAPAIDNNVYYYNGSGYVDTGIDYVKGVWQTWQIDYTFVTGLNNDPWIISVDRNTSAPIHGGPGAGEAITNLRYLSFYTGANSSGFFIDAPVAVIPEPSTVLLMVAGAGMLWRRRQTSHQ